MDAASPRRIVVGVNGSVASLAALRWAAGEAALRRASLLVVHVWDRTRGQLAPYAMRGRQSAPGQERMAAATRLAATVRAAFGAAPPAGVITELAEGLVVRVLLDRAAEADLLVLGATTLASTPTSPGLAVGPTAGPVARACLSRADCPVVIVSAPAAMSGADVAGALGSATVGTEAVGAAGRGSVVGGPRGVVGGPRGRQR